jgi:unsaturated chondroitin disaccharide hydrolase
MTLRAQVRGLAIGVVLLAAVAPRTAAAQDLDSLVTHALQFAAQQLATSATTVNDPTRFPRSTLADGSWKLEDSGDWTSGFFAGCLWQIHGWTSGSSFRTWAAEWTTGVEGEAYNTTTHDVGFKILCSFGAGSKVTGDPAYPSVLRQGAQSLATRFDPVVGCTRSWDRYTFPVIIDNMMNLEILFWAARNGGDPAWYDMAVSHALRTRQDHVRADGSTYHLVDYDPVTGAVLSRGTVQGHSNSSTWARGQAWGLHGFTIAYRETRDTRFLDTARLLADWFIDHLPVDHVPYWDFDAPNIPNEPKDTSAGAIAASGLFELSMLVPDAASRTRYREAAEAILASLCSPGYLAEGSTSRGILLHGVGHKPNDTEVDVSLIYGDYYFLEALLRYERQLTSVEPGVGEPRVGPAAPNPFAAATRIGFHLPAAGTVEVSVFDVRGAEVARLAAGRFAAGDHVLHWDGSRRGGGRAPSGLYFVTVRAGQLSRTRKVVLAH